MDARTEQQRADASPPKKPATTARTPADSWPSHNALCCVQTIW